LKNNMIDKEYLHHWPFAPEKQEAFFHALMKYQTFWTEPRYKFAGGFEGPLYVDLRKIISDPELLRFSGEKLAEILKNIGAEVIAVCSMSGDAWGVAASLASDIPVVLLRKKPHYHGPESIICGFPFPKDAKIVLLEDSVATSGQLKGFYDQLVAEGYTNIKEVVTLINTMTLEPGKHLKEKFLAEHGLQYHYVVSMGEFWPWLKDKGYVSEEYYQVLVDWISDPVTWPTKQSNWDNLEKLKTEGKVYFKYPEDVVRGARM